MPNPAVLQTLQAALAQYRAGNPLAAEKLCRQVLAHEPNHVDALNLLGGCLYQTGNLNEAIEVYERIAALKPDLPEAHNNLGGCLQRSGQVVEAIAAFETAIKLKGDFPVAKSNLAAAYFEWGNALSAKGQTAEALEAFQQAVALKPDFIEALEKIGQCLQSLEKFDGAVAAFQTIIRLKPEAFEAFNNLGIGLKSKGQLDEAIASFRQAIRLKPDLAEAHNNLGNALRAKGQLDEAVAALRQAVRLKPDFAQAHNNLGLALTDIGERDGAIASLRQAIRLNPDFVVAHSNLIFILHFHPGYDAKMIQEELRRWNRQHAEPLKKFIQPHANSRDPDRRLRIGYLSPDFREHVVGQILSPLLREHDRRQMEIFCYANVERPDVRTDELRRHADVWRSILGMSDSHAADLIRRDGIDILVDLALHTAGSRLGIFAQKPAPVQATYLGYCGSTGMEAMDYRLSDPYLDPLDSDLSVYSEQTIRLPETYWCYRSTGPTPEPSPSPAAAAGYVTFGCLNNFAKASPPALDLWADILQGVPRSRLIVHSNPGSHLDALRERFAGKGVSPDRLEFYLERGAWLKYVQTYGRIDIALDPFPWGGGITTCDALWLGVPVVSLVGRTAVGRGGASILANVGVPELIARTPQQYVQIATDLAKDLPRLAELRRTLRARMLASPLADAPRFARNIEAAYRQMWRSWCAEGGESAGPITLEQQIESGFSHHQAGRLAEAERIYRQVLARQPDHADALHLLGVAAGQTNRLDEAVNLIRQAIAIGSTNARYHSNLGKFLKDNGQFDQAIASYRQAIALNPDIAELHFNLGNALREMGQSDEAIASYRQAIGLKPEYADACNNLVYSLAFHPGYDARMIHEELRRWNQQYAEPLKKFIRPHTNNRDPDRRLRIGYVSPDFRVHVVGQNLLPLLREHDHRQMEIFCYANVPRPDALSEQLRRHADVWRSIVELSDSQAADLIRRDGIDILVDLALHTAGNRLGIFAQKPAPVQATYLGYCGSTGMDAMDYRLSDPYLDPSDSDLSFYSERTIRLPETYWCYSVSGPTPEPLPPPAAAAGYVTVGCLNNSAKVSPPALDLWAEILRRMPRSRLIVHSHPGAHLDAVRERFAGKGVSPDRLEFPIRQPWPEYVRTYGRIDIALDPFPWGGGITTCDALWMGVPVVSLVGRTAVGRGGASILANVGLPELIALTPREYVQIATDLAKDLPRLAELRRTLRPGMEASPLMDAPRFARNIEAAYRQMWRNWCEQQRNWRSPVTNDK